MKLPGPSDFLITERSASGNPLGSYRRMSASGRPGAVSASYDQVTNAALPQVIALNLMWMLRNVRMPAKVDHRLYDEGSALFIGIATLL